MSWLSAAGKLFRPIGHLGMEIGRGINKAFEKDELDRVIKKLPEEQHFGGKGQSAALPQSYNPALNALDHPPSSALLRTPDGLPPVTAPTAPTAPPVDAGLSPAVPPPPVDSSMPGSLDYQQYQANAPTPAAPQPPMPPTQPGPPVPPPPVDGSMPGSQDYQNFQATQPTYPGRDRYAPGAPVNENLPAPPPANPNDLVGQTAADLDTGSRLMRSTGDIYRDIDANQNSIELTGQGKDPGKPREHSFWKRLGQGMVKGYKNWDGKGGIFGLATSALGTGVGSAASPQQHQVTMLKDKQRGLMRDLGAAQEREQYQTKQAKDEAVIDNYYQDNAIAAAEHTRKVNADVARERTARMQTVAGLFKNLPVFTPGDPKFKEIEEAMGDAKLPLAPKDAKKNVKMIQDQRSGAWSVVLTDPVSGKQETRPVMQGGKQLKTTPTVVMQGEISLARQNDQQDFQAGQNELGRKESVKKFILGKKLDKPKYEAGLKKAGLKGEALKAAMAEYDQIIAENSNQ